MDTVDAETRSRVMARIRSKDTTPELAIRKALFAEGYRYRLHQKDIPGRPDIVLRKYNSAIFVNGCFWHGHDGCELFRMPKSHRRYWKKKISTNQKRDQRNLDESRLLGWRSLVIWECALKGSGKLTVDQILKRTSKFLNSNRKSCIIRGRQARK